MSHASPGPLRRLVAADELARGLARVVSSRDSLVSWLTPEQLAMAAEQLGMELPGVPSTEARRDDDDGEGPFGTHISPAGR